MRCDGYEVRHYRAEMGDKSKGESVMRNYLIQNLFVVPFYLVSCCAFAQASYAPPTTLERNIETYVVKSDGSYAQTTEVVIRV
jgi:hypothetical protein